MNWRIPVTKKDFISGYFYYKLCDWNVCPRYNQNLSVLDINENDLVFLNLDYIEQFVNYLDNNLPINKFILVTQNSDRDFTQQMFNSIEKYVNKIYAINSLVSNEKLIKIPLGFNDHSTEILENEDFTFNNKEKLVYVNFKLHHHSDRPKCFEYFSNFNWVDIEDSIISTKDFYDKLRTFKYCISPRGTGIDTHRLYESLMYGVIPIVKKSTLDDLYSNFPIVLVDKWEDVTYEFLINNYDKNLSNYFSWLSKNPNWYKSENWIKK